jgi:shikimate dehydrogenase
MTVVAGVIGSPIAHSLSPAIFAAAFDASGLDWVYNAYEVGEADAAAFMDEVREHRIEGLSVTMPDKAAVIPALDQLSPVARALGAVNCVARQDGRLWGHNTDGDGLVDALREDDAIDLAGRRCAVVGAGGAGRAVARALAEAGAASVMVVNRSADRAQAAAALAGAVGAVGDASDIAAADLVVNTTPLGMGGDAHLPFDVSLVSGGQIVVDIVYHPIVTPLLAGAAAAGARTVGGLGMLVHQAGHAFRLWTGQEPPLDAMRAGATAALAARSGS